MLALFAIATTAAVSLIRSWAVPVYWTVIDYLSDHDPSDTEMIRDLWPRRLIQPSWLATGPNLLTRWQHAEMNARISLIVVLWLTIVAVLLATLFRHREHKRT